MIIRLGEKNAQKKMQRPC